MRSVLALVCCVCVLASAGMCREVRVTVYNSNIGVVRDSRSTTIEKGISHISMDEIASRIDPTSVKLEISGRGDIAVMEQNFEFDLLSPDKLLNKYLEHEVDITTSEDVKYHGTLIGFDSRNLVLSLAGERVAMVSRDKVTDIVLPAIDTGLIVKPTLFWTVNSSSSARVDLEVAYITEGMNWHAEYIATIAEDDDEIELASWVSVENRSGATYPDAKLKLIAGDVHRVQDKIHIRGGRTMEYAEMAPQPMLEEKAFFEYHMYTLDSKTTLKDKEVKQIQLFPAKDVAALKQYNLDSHKGEKVRVVMRFDNSEESGLGVPLPEGKVRVFKADVDGSLEFLGEDRIDHTPRDEEVKIYVGNAFDIVAESVRTDFSKTTDRVVMETFEIRVSNHKDEDVVLTITEHIYGDWDVRRESHPFEKLKSDTIEFQLPVEANGEAVLTYTVRRKI
jgi:hypothetical protein